MKAVRITTDAQHRTGKRKEYDYRLIHWASTTWISLRLSPPADKTVLHVPLVLFIILL